MCVCELSTCPSCIPFCGYGFHRLTHQRILVQNTVEMIHAQREEITVRLRPDTGHSPGVRQQTNLAEIRAIRQGRGHLKFRVVITFWIAARTQSPGWTCDWVSFPSCGSECENFLKLHVSMKIDTNLIASFRPPSVHDDAALPKADNTWLLYWGVVIAKVALIGAEGTNFGN